MYFKIGQYALRHKISIIAFLSDHVFAPNHVIFQLLLWFPWEQFLSDSVMCLGNIL